MADPSREEEGLLREWAPLTGLLQQIPAKAQRGIFTHDLNLTCIDCLPDFLAVGTNLGLVYWYNRQKGDLQRLRCENTASAITCVKVISTVDYMVAAGNEQGIVTVFQIPKSPPDSVPESMKPKKNKQVERYTISGLHISTVTAIEWSMNGMKLFSGDKNGLVVLTEIDFYMHLSKSIELLNEKYEIVQLSYCQQLLLVSTLYRSIVCHHEDRWRVAQVGQKERKALGKLGATFFQGSACPQDIVVYSSRPGLRVWLADKNGIVQQTLIYKDTMMLAHTYVPLINPAPAHMCQSRGDHRFGPLLTFRSGLLVTYSSDAVYVLDPSNISVVATVADLRKVQGVAVTKDEIFILEGERSLVRVAYTPESHVLHVQGALCSSNEATESKLNCIFVRLVAGPLVQAMLGDDNIPKMSVWSHVASEMAMAGFPFGEDAAIKCHSKWCAIIKSYNKRALSPVSGRNHRPLHFDVLEQVLSKSDSQISNQNIEMSQGAIIDSVVSENIVISKNQLKNRKRKLISPHFIDDSSLETVISKSASNSYESTDSVSGRSYTKTYLMHREPKIEKSSETSTDNYSKTFTFISSSSKTTGLEYKSIFYLTEVGNAVQVCENGVPSSSTRAIEVYLKEDSSELSSVNDSDSDAESLKNIWKHGKTRVDSNMLNNPQWNEPSVVKELVITPRPYHPLRPVPTSAEAMMSLILRLNKEDKQIESLRESKMEEKWDHLADQIEEQAMIRDQLFQMISTELDVDLKLDQGH